VTGPRRTGRMLAVDYDGTVIFSVPCLSADMVFPGWMRLVLPPEQPEGKPTISWWQAPPSTNCIEWQPDGGDRP
jgi:hypothetical protein